jgi:UDP-N-acetylmuramate dehydrogenase
LHDVEVIVERDVPIGPMTTYRVGGSASLFVRVDSEDDIAELISIVQEQGLDVLVVGKGSNLLVADDGFDGLAVTLGDAFGDITIDGTTVSVGAAAALPVVARRTAAAGLTGFEWAVGVPGSIGGAVRMNAGGHGSDMAATLTRVRVTDLASGDDGWMAASALALGYRSSSITRTQLVITAELALATGSRERSEAEITEIVRWRRENQPGGQNAGSVFTNPSGDSAGRLIEAAGCKGLRVGTAVVSDKHANFFIADPDGRANDVHALMTVVRDRVHRALGVWLEPETRLVGFAENPGLEVEG